MTQLPPIDSFPALIWWLADTHHDTAVWRIAPSRPDGAWKPALVEIEEALVPAFIIEELEDGRFTVFVPSVPTPFAGAVYILSRERVHALDVPFTQAIRSISRWGSGSKDLVAAMTKAEQ
jgi:uncharacterized membrane protein